MREAEKYYTHAITTMQNDRVAHALCQCGLLTQKNCEDLKHLTAHQISRVHLQIILHINDTDFAKMCDHIKDQELVKSLKELYFGKFQS